MLASESYVVTDGFLTAGECRRLLEAIERFRSTTDLPEIYRAAKGRALHYSVIDGHQIRDDLPDIWGLYTGSVQEHISEFAGEPMFPLDNVRAGVNVNIMPPGRSEYRWHYDRSPATAILYLNEVDGGETELYPGLRLLLTNQRWARTQRALDRVAATRPVRSLRSEKVAVSPRIGRLVAMTGNRTLHSVCGVDGPSDRLNIILAYDRKGATFEAEEGLDAYLYSTEHGSPGDPNYRR